MDHSATAPNTNPPPRYTAYDDFAWFYDRYWSRGTPLVLLGAAERLLLSELPVGARVLDLCCGTGRISGALAERGYRVTGIDGSAQMLRLARANAPGADFIAADARDFRLAEPVDVVISLFDSLNHVLALDELARVFESVRAALRDGGRFLFDMNFASSFARYWQGESFTTVEPDHACIVRGAYDPETRLGRCDVTLFREREGAWHRADVVIEERCYTEAEVAGALEAAGFREVRRYDAERDLRLAGHEGRLFFLARR
jgi:SAM-dependent methyltransferase